MLENFWRIFFPAVCPICGRVLGKETKICDDCKKEVAVIKEPRCIKCGKPLITDEKLYCKDCEKKKHYFDKGVSVFEYSDVFKESMYRFKYGNAREYADYYGNVAATKYAELLKEWNIEVIIPVPMYNKKEKKRGYNQATVFGRALSKYTGLKLDTCVLIRSKNTVPQKELNDEQRRENLRDAFKIDAERIKGVHSVLLVDDIYTTGSTIDACARLLKQAGVEKVYFLCISSGR